MGVTQSQERFAVLYILVEQSIQQTLRFLVVSQMVCLQIGQSEDPLSISGISKQKVLVLLLGREKLHFISKCFCVPEKPVLYRLDTDCLVEEIVRLGITILLELSIAPAVDGVGVERGVHETIAQESQQGDENCTHHHHPQDRPDILPKGVSEGLPFFLEGQAGPLFEGLGQGDFFTGNPGNLGGNDSRGRTFYQYIDERPQILSGNLLFTDQVFNCNL